MAKNWRENFKQGRELVLATSSLNGKPNANVVVSLGFIGEKLLVADCLMKTTIDNLKSNPRISVVSGKYKINGVVEIFSSGGYFDECVQRSAKISSDKVRNAILIDSENIFDLYKANLLK